MVERIPSKPKTPKSPETVPFTSGALVRIRTDIHPGLVSEIFPLQAGKIYKIFHVDKNDPADPGGDTAWIGPADAIPSDVDSYDPEEALRDPRLDLQRYKNVHPINVERLQVVLN